MHCGTLIPSQPVERYTPDTELQRQTTRALVAEGLVAALTDAARALSATLHSKLNGHGGSRNRLRRDEAGTGIIP